LSYTWKCIFCRCIYHVHWGVFLNKKMANLPKVFLVNQQDPIEEWFHHGNLTTALFRVVLGCLWGYIYQPLMASSPHLMGHWVASFQYFGQPPFGRLTFVEQSWHLRNVFRTILTPRATSTTTSPCTTSSARSAAAPGGNLIKRVFFFFTDTPVAVFKKLYFLRNL